MLSDAEKTQLDSQGYVLLRDVITPGEADQLRGMSLALAAMDRVRDQAILEHGNSQRVFHLVGRGEAFERIIQHPRILSAVEYLLQDGFTLSAFSANIIGAASATETGLHVDYPWAYVPAPRPAFALSVQTVWYLDDFTRENGATRAIPGSHRWVERLPDPAEPYDDSVHLTGPKGSVLILNGGVWHNSSENLTTRARVGLLGFFVRSIVKPQHDHREVTPPEVIARATPRLKHLLGVERVES